LLKQKKKFLDFNNFDNNITNEFVVNPSLKSPNNYYKQIKDKKTINAYGGNHTLPHHNAEEWTSLEYNYIIKPLQEFVKKFNNNLEPFTLQRLCYENKKDGLITLSAHFDPYGYEVIAGMTIDESIDAKFTLSLIDGQKEVVTSKTFKINECYILKGHAVTHYKHQINVIGSRLAVVVRFVDKTKLDADACFP